MRSLNLGKRKFLAVCIALILFLGVGIGVLAYALSADRQLEARDVLITNRTDTGFTVVWTSTKQYSAKIVYSTKDEWGIFKNSDKEFASDDRDVEKKVARYTHHVTVRNLNPDTEYFIRLDGRFQDQELEVTSVRTQKLRDQLSTPDPAYGQVKNVEQNDSLLIMGNRQAEAEVPELVSTTIPENGAYSIDISPIRVAGEDLFGFNLFSSVRSGKYIAAQHDHTSTKYKPLDTIEFVKQETAKANPLIPTIKAVTNTCSTPDDLDVPVEERVNSDGTGKVKCVYANPDNPSDTRWLRSQNYGYSSCLGVSRAIGGANPEPKGWCLSNRTDGQAVFAGGTVPPPTSGPQPDPGVPTSPSGGTSGLNCSTENLGSEISYSVKSAANFRTGSSTSANPLGMLAGGVTVTGCSTAVSGGNYTVYGNSSDQWIKVQSGDKTGYAALLLLNGTAIASTTSTASTTSVPAQTPEETNVPPVTAPPPVTNSPIPSGTTTVPIGTAASVFDLGIGGTKGAYFVSSISSSGFTSTSYQRSMGGYYKIYDFMEENNAICAINTNYGVNGHTVGFAGNNGDIGYGRPSISSNTGDLQGISVVLVMHPGTISADNYSTSDIARMNFTQDLNGDGLKVPVATSRLAIIYIYPDRGDEAKINGILAALKAKNVSQAHTGGTALTLNNIPTITGGSFAYAPYTILGWKGDSFYSIVVDGAGLDGMHNVVNSLGLENALIFDGGGSSQIVCKDSNMITQIGRPIETDGIFKYHPDEAAKNDTYWIGRPFEEGPRKVTAFFGVSAPAGIQVAYTPGETTASAPSTLTPDVLGQGATNISESGRYEISNGQTVIERDIVLEGENGKVVMFEDINFNGVYDEGEKIIKEEISNTFKITKKAEAVDYRLNSGWNLIHLPLVNSADGIDKASELLSEWQRQGADVLHLSRFSAGKFQMFSKREDGTSYNNDFELVPGEGLFVFNRSGNKKVTYSGSKIEEPVSLNVSNGWNLIGVVSPGKDYTSESLISKFSEAGIKSNAVSQYENGVYQSVVVEDGDLFGNNFNLNDKKGYFVKISEGGKEFTP